jgi:hypothetical protein
MQGVAPRVADHLEAVQGPHRGQDRRRVGALPAPRLDELVVVAPRGPGIAQQRRGCACDEAGAKCPEDRRITPGLRELQAQRLLPVDTTAHGVGCVAIRAPFGAWEEGDARPPPGG